MNNFLKIPHAFKAAAKTMASNDALRMAGATAFFTSFALPPVLIIIVRTFGLFMEKRTVGRHILGKISSVIGKEGGEQILSVIRSVRHLQQNWLATGLIFLFLLFVATTLFNIVKSSINQLWHIRVDTNKKVKQVFRTRVKALGIILFTGLLFMAVMMLDIMQAFLGKYLFELSPQVANYVFSVTNHIISLVVITIWFFILFRYLPDGRPGWQVALTGAFVTGILFSIGKYILRFLLVGGNIGAIYGTSGSLALILLFVFYCSLILYYGASFTKAWARECDDPIVPNKNAVHYHITMDDAPDLSFGK
jgi:Predicted membrane protein